jgi:hypothetical protein
MHEVRGMRAVTAVWTVLLAPLAASTLVLRVSIYCALSFRSAAWLLLAASLVSVAVAVLCLRRRLADLPDLCARADRTAMCVAIMACLLAAIATTCLHRADADDAIYLPKIVHYLSYPLAPVDGSVYEIANPSVLAFPRAAAPYYPTAYEFAQGSFAYLGRFDFLYVCYLVAPLFAGVLGMAALMSCIRLTGVSSLAAAVSGVLLVPLILLLGETHRSYGNISLARAFQSKYAFFLFGIPIFISMSIAFFRRRDALTWSGLVVVVVALCGMTTSALVMLPLLAVLLFAAWHLARWDHPRLWFGAGMAYAAGLAPAAIFALEFHRFAVARLGYGSPVNAGFPQSFDGQFALLELEAAIPLSILVFALATIACLMRARRNAFVLIWSALAIVLYLNAVTAGWIMRHVASENIYWRLFYLLPFPLLPGIALAQMFDDLPSARFRRWFGGALFALFGALVVFSPTSVLRDENRVHVGPPGLTLDDLAPAARKIIALAPEGVVLAPIALAQDMAILSARHRQIATRADFMANALTDRPEDFNVRFSASSFAAGTGGRLEDLDRVLQLYKPSTVVFARGALSCQAIDAMLAYGLRKVADVDGWVVYVRA